MKVSIMGDTMPTSRAIDSLNLDPFNIAPSPIAGGSHSVNDPYHPANDQRQRENDRDYVFRQRDVNPLKLTLGWELEANHVPQIVPNGVNHIGDGSVNGDGAEFVVLPAVTKSPRYVLGLLKGLVHSPKLNTDESCGFHVHVSAMGLALPKMRHWALATEHLALQVEDSAFKAVPDSRKDNQYCRRIRPIQNGARFVSSKYSNDRRYHWLNTVEMFRPNGIRTIENRLLGHTHRWKYVLAWALFTMELAQRGWDVANHPFVIGNHVEALENLLQRIITEIKPLDKRSLPAPQWIYEGLAKHGIDQSTWDRPLAKLTETEYRLKGMSLPFYSDNQPEIENESDDEDSCACGCGEEGRCEDQTHSDGDCDSNYCDRCHENGDCGGSPSCERCIADRHDEGEDCGRERCGSCHPRPRLTPNVEVNQGGTVTGRITSSNISVHPSNAPLTMGSLRAAVSASRSQPIDYAAFYHMPMVTIPLQNTINDAVIYGQGIADMLWVDESVNVGTSVLPTVPEAWNLPMTDAERLASDARERSSPSQSGRALTIAEANEHIAHRQECRARDMMTALERDASIERMQMRRGCPVDCRNSHDTDCLTCGQSWGEHSGHDCTQGGGIRGSFPIGGR